MFKLVQAKVAPNKWKIKLTTGQDQDGVNQNQRLINYYRIGIKQVEIVIE